MNEEIILVTCDKCHKGFTSDEILHFSPENDSRILRVCEKCYDKLDNKKPKEFFS